MGHSNICDTRRGKEQCHQKTQGGGRGFPKCHVTFFEYLIPIFAFVLVFKGN